MDNISRAGVAVLHITDLPDGILVSIASYLAKPSIALFAIAMTADSEQQTQTRKAIISSTNWSVLSFSDIEKSLAAKLSDDHIDKILKSIDAINNLKILKLGGCVNISGSGIGVLGSSIVIQQIDLSLVGKHESPLIEPEPLLSEDLVLPILDDIISRGRGSNLKQLDFPKKWRNTASTQMTQFLERYNEFLTNQRFSCSECNRNDLETVLVYIGGVNHPGYGTQCNTCTRCLNHFCTECSEEEGACWCGICQKEYCQDCVSSYRCGSCQETFCQKCKEVRWCEGEDCGECYCVDCSQEYTCCSCNLTRCGECSVSYHCYRVGCGNAICFDCVQTGDEGGECRCGVEYCSSDCRHHIQESRKVKGKNTCLDCALDGTSLH